MSYSLENARPVLLVQSQGQWSLETEKLVQVNGCTFRPYRQRLNGREAIVNHLATVDNGLLKETLGLLECDIDAEQERTYEPRGGGWVAYMAPQAVGGVAALGAGPAGATGPAAASGAVGASAPGAQAPAAQGPAATDPKVMEEIGLLYDRVEQLERKLSLFSEQVSLLMNGDTGGADDDMGMGALAAELAGDAPLDPTAFGGESANDSDAPAPSASTPPRPPAVPMGSGGEAGDGLEAALGGADAGEPAEAAAAPEPPAFPVLKVPAVDAIAEVVKGLAGEELSVNAVSADWDLAGGPTYMGRLKDDDGLEVGLLVMDLEATVQLGGGMLMEPEETLKEQIGAGTPSEDVLDAAGEVLNTMTSAVNKIRENFHVKVSHLETLDSAAIPWLAHARARQNFTISVGGRLAVVMC